MVDPIDDIRRQARQGSVSAIIQVLNDKLADSKVRSRAIFSEGVLQLLCEAPEVTQLEQPTLVPRIRKILESLQPRNIRRVKINSRIVREQQLLWLEEINRDPDGQLLWSEEIILDRPSPLQRFKQDLKDGRTDSKTTALPRPAPTRRRENRVFWRGLLGGASLSLFLALVGWAFYTWLAPKFQQTATNPAASPASPATSAPPSTPISQSAPSSSAQPIQPAQPAASQDPFVLAVRLAQENVTAGKSAKTSADWLAIASQWQRASDLMGKVPNSDERYAIAQDRVKLYQTNSQTATQQAEQFR
jgi:hypothetical protein